MGGTVIGAQAFLSGCKREDKAINELFTESDVGLMNEIGETIIPTTDTPGAKAVGIGSFMAMMVLDTYTPEDQQIFQAGLDKIRQDFETQYGESFMETSEEVRHEYLSRLNEELTVFTNNKKEGDKEHYFRMLKELTLLGYFTSEIGATQALRYVETPGRYEACIPYEKGDRVWAT
jgi:hypothetical protein